MRLIKTRVASTGTEEAGNWLSTKLIFKRQTLTIDADDQSAGPLGPGFKLSDKISSDKSDSKGALSYILDSTSGNAFNGLVTNGGIQWSSY